VATNKARPDMSGYPHYSQKELSRCAVLSLIILTCYTYSAAHSVNQYQLSTGIL